MQKASSAEVTYHSRLSSIPHVTFVLFLDSVVSILFQFFTFHGIDMAWAMDSHRRYIERYNYNYGT